MFCCQDMLTLPVGEVRKKLQALFRDQNILKVRQNLNFQVPVRQRHAPQQDAC